MSRNDQIRWDKKHELDHEPDRPSSFLVQIFDNARCRIPPGRALDIATGKGRNACFLAARGFDVVAIDVSPVALQEARVLAEKKMLQLTWRQSDLEQIELPEVHFDVILNFNYLQRSLIPEIKKALKAGGYIIFDTYLIDQQNVGHPKNPAYLLDHNEPLNFFRDFRVLFYREGKVSDGEEEAYRAGIFAQKVR